MTRMEKNNFYDKLCRVLTDYEHPEDHEDYEVGEEDLYEMLVEVQNNWEYLTGDEDD